MSGASYMRYTMSWVALVAQRLGRWTSDPVVASSIPGRSVIRTPRSTQPSISPGSVNRVPAFAGWGYGGMRSLVSGSR